MNDEMTPREKKWRKAEKILFAAGCGAGLVFLLSSWLESTLPGLVDMFYLPFVILDYGCIGVCVACVLSSMSIFFVRYARAKPLPADWAGRAKLFRSRG